MWQTGTTQNFDRWFEGLDEKAQVEIAAAVRVLSQFGPTLGRPLVDTLKGSKYANLKELRILTSDMVIRIAFAFDPLQRAILLTGGHKGGVSERRFYKQLIAAAEKEYAAHLQSIKKQLEARAAAAK